MRVVILPETCIKVPIEVLAVHNTNSWFMEKCIQQDSNARQIYGSPDSLISAATPFLHISNFSDCPVVIAKGQALGQVHNPKNWLDREEPNENSMEQRNAYARFIRTLV